MCCVDGRVWPKIRILSCSSHEIAFIFVSRRKIRFRYLDTLRVEVFGNLAGQRIDGNNGTIWNGRKKVNGIILSKSSGWREKAFPSRVPTTGIPDYSHKRVCVCVCFRFRDTRCHRTASDTVCARFIDKYLQLEALCDHIYVILIIMCATTKHLACVRTSHRKAERVLRECRTWRCDCKAVARTLCSMPHRCASDASVSILRIGTCKSHFSIVLSSFMRNK